ncbi:hypothetical protein AKUG0406_TOXIN100130 (plasmid) [Apilactobacillus kunkeei]|nr:hypothetical protein AKUG0406_TOXIN100130 [Apilactobacillus kunkeei]
MQYGYARVSTLGQSLDNQVQDLRDNGVLKKNIYTDKYTGTSTDRVGFQKLLVNSTFKSFFHYKDPLSAMILYCY